MTLAYIHGSQRKLREVYLKAKPEFQLTDDHLLEIVRSLYGLAY